MSPSQEAAIILDAILTGVIRAQLWGDSARAELRTMLRDQIEEVSAQPTDCRDQMILDVLGVFLVHLEHIDDGPFSCRADPRPDVLAAYRKSLS